MRAPAALLGAAHPEPAVAVTVLGGLLAVAWGAGTGSVVLVVLAVLTSQLSIGWSNDLVDRRRDVQVGRDDKPLATGAVSPVVVGSACAAALVATVPLGFALGVAAGGIHLVNTAAGWAYNLGMKATPLSAVPYVVAFGGLPWFVALADPATGPLRVWSVPAGALLGVGAHLLNVLPDLADDAATGVRGLPHRLGEQGSRVLAVLVLLAASVVIVVGSRPPAPVAAPGLLLVVVLSGVGLLGRGRIPFLGAVAIALIDVALLVAAPR